MKFTIVVASLIGMAVASHAQQPPQASPMTSQLDQIRKVPSPNRTLSKTLAMSNKSEMPKRQEDKSMQADNASIKWVDSTGRTMGRDIGDYAITAAFDNQLATLTGLSADTNCDANRSRT